MKKKKEKKKFKRQDIRLQNIEIGDLEHFEESEVIEEKRAASKIVDKAETSQKSDLELKLGRILEIKSNYSCLAEVEGKKIECNISGRLKQMNYETRTPVAVGDLVNIDFSEQPRIEEILPRRNTLSRYSEENFQKQVIIASNLDQVIITISVKQPYLNLGLVDRYVCTTRLQEIIPVICVNKIDLATDMEQLKQVMSFYDESEIKVVFCSAVTGEGITELKDLLKDQNSVFSGLSGTGKSTLINKLQPGLDLKVSQVSNVSSKGIHTTTSAKLINWDFGGYLVDTPGIKTFGLHRNDRYRITRIFPGFDKIYMECKFADCSHDHEIDCAVKRAVDKGKFPVERYESYLRLLDSLQ